MPHLLAMTISHAIRNLTLTPQVAALLERGTPAERHYFFSPENSRPHWTPAQCRLDWAYRFFLWEKFYLAPDLKYARNPFHFRRAGWYYDAMQNRTKWLQYTELASREFLKTFDVKNFILYLHFYRRANWTPYISLKRKKLNNEMRTVRQLLARPMVVHDYAPEIAVSTGEKIVFRHEDSSTSLLSADTAETFVRGDLHAGLKPEWLFLDDIESKQTARSVADTTRIYEILQQDIMASMFQRHRTIFMVNNYFSKYGLSLIHI